MHMLHERIQGVFDIGRIGIAMADHVHRNGPKVLGVTPEVARALPWLASITFSAALPRLICYRR
jgi:hypothetical protein